MGQCHKSLSQRQAARSLPLRSQPEGLAASAYRRTRLSAYFMPVARPPARASGPAATSPFIWSAATWSPAEKSFVEPNKRLSAQDGVELPDDVPEPCRNKSRISEDRQTE